MNRFIIAVSLTALICTACQVKEYKESSISEIVQQRESLDGKRVFVRGYIEIDVLDHPNFVEEKGPPVGERITHSIDLIPHDNRIQQKLSGFDGECVVVDGVFQLYGPHKLPISGLVSMYGAVDAKDIRPCGR